MRSRGQRVTFWVLVVLLLAATALAVITKSNTAAWLVGVTAFVAGVGAVWTRWRDQRAVESGVVRRAVGGALTVADADLRVMRTHPEVERIPYLPRAAKEAELAQALEDGPVVLVGASMVGKTRLAAEVVKERYPDRPLLIPDSATALVDLDKGNILVKGHVVWLDDLERFLTSGLTPGLVRRLGERNAVVATLRAREWDRFQPTDQLRPPEWEVLRVFHKVTLGRELPDLAAIPDQATRDRIANVGVGEYVGAAHHIRQQVEHGPDANPVGFAFVLGAVDWYGTGHTRPVPAEALDRLAATQLDERRRADLLDEDRRKAALAWATREINPRVSLLEPVEGGYAVYDYALDHLARTERRIPDETWEIAVEHATDAERQYIGFIAFTLHGRADLAESAWERSEDPVARYNLGVLVELRGGDGRELFRPSAEQGLVHGMHRLGAGCARRGEWDEGRGWLERAAAEGHAVAAYQLGIEHGEREQLDEALRWFLRAAELGEPQAGVGLGAYANEFAKAGDDAEAERWFRLSEEHGGLDCAVNHGIFLAERGRLDEAERRFRAGAEAGLPDGVRNLVVLLTEKGEPEEALRWAREAVAAGHEEAEVTLARTLIVAGRREEGERLLREAADAGDLLAMAVLASVIFSRPMMPEEVEQARALLLRAAEGGVEEALQLVDLFNAQHEKERRARTQSRARTRKPGQGKGKRRR